MFIIFACITFYCCFICCIVPLAAKDKKKKKKKEEDGPYTVHTFKEKGDDLNNDDDDTVYEDENDSQSYRSGRSMYESQRDFVEQLYLRRNNEYVTAEVSVITDRMLDEDQDIDEDDMAAINIAMSDFRASEDYNKQSEYFDPESPNKSENPYHFDAASYMQSLRNEYRFSYRIDGVDRPEESDEIANNNNNNNNTPEVQEQVSPERTNKYSIRSLFQRDTSQVDNIVTNTTKYSSKKVTSPEVIPEPTMKESSRLESIPARDNVNKISAESARPPPQNEVSQVEKKSTGVTKYFVRPSAKKKEEQVEKSVVTSSDYPVERTALRDVLVDDNTTKFNRSALSSSQREEDTSISTGTQLSSQNESDQLVEGSVNEAAKYSVQSSSRRKVVSLVEETVITTTSYTTQSSSRKVVNKSDGDKVVNVTNYSSQSTTIDPAVEETIVTSTNYSTPVEETIIKSINYSALPSSQVESSEVDGRLTKASKYSVQSSTQKVVSQVENTVIMTSSYSTQSSSQREVSQVEGSVTNTTNLSTRREIGDINESVTNLSASENTSDDQYAAPSAKLKSFKDRINAIFNEEE